MTSGSSDLVDIACTIVHQTDRGILIDDGTRQAWLPKALTEVNDDGTVTVSEWLAKHKGLI